jgi:uncharacterized protein
VLRQPSLHAAIEHVIARGPRRSKVVRRRATGSISRPTTQRSGRAILDGMTVISGSGRGRIDALDVLRGVAILGTFGTNVWLFAHPGGPVAWMSQVFVAGDPVDVVLRTLTNGKFLALLTLLFGVGIELQYRSAVRRGSPWPGRYPVRAAILFAEGLVHYVLVFEFDVLMGYAIASLVVAYLVGRSDRAVRAWMGVVGGIYVAVLLAVTALLVATPEEAASGSAPDPTLTASWPHQVQLRLEHAALLRAEIVLIVPSAVVLFLVGSRLVRAGAFTPDGAGVRRRLVAVGLGVGVPLNALTAAAGPDWFLVERYVAPPLVALGLLGLGTTLVHRARRGPGPLRARRDGGRAHGALVLRPAERARRGPLLRVGLRPGGALRRRGPVVRARALDGDLGRAPGGRPAVAAPRGEGPAGVPDAPGVRAAQSTRLIRRAARSSDRYRRTRRSSETGMRLSGRTGRVG